MSKKDTKEPLEEVESVGDAETNQKMINQMIALSQKYGGKGLEDYANVVPPAEQQKMLKQGNLATKVSGLRQATQDRATRQKVAAAQKNASLIQGLKGAQQQQRQSQIPGQPVKFFPPPPLKTEAGMTTSDPHMAEELTTFILNDKDIYERGIVPVIRNLKKKMVKGVYNPQLALKLWFYVVTAAAQKYVKEFYSEGTSWHKEFSAQTRRDVAESLAEHFSSELA